MTHGERKRTVGAGHARKVSRSACLCVTLMPSTDVESRERLLSKRMYGKVCYIRRWISLAHETASTATSAISADKLSGPIFRYINHGLHRCQSHGTLDGKLSSMNALTSMACLRSCSISARSIRRCISSIITSLPLLFTNTLGIEISTRSLQCRNGGSASRMYG